MSGSFRIIFWNANGIQRQLQLFEDFLHRNAIDVALVSETHLSSKLFVSLINYNVYRNDRPLPPGQKVCGGVSVFVHKKYKYLIVPNRAFSTFEVCSICIEDRLLGKVNLSAIYRRNGALNENELKDILNIPHPAIIAGDFNARSTVWGSSYESVTGRKINQTVNALPNWYAIGPQEPTHFNAATSTWDTIDFALLKDIPWRVSCNSIDDLLSDHSPVLLDLQTTNLVPCINSTTRINWDRFLELLPVEPPVIPLVVQDDIDAAVDIFTQAMSTAVELAREEVAPVIEFLPKAIHRMVRQRNRLKRQWYLYRDPRVKHLFNQCNHKLQKSIKKYRLKKLNLRYKKAMSSPDMFWKFMRQNSCKRKKIAKLADASGKLYLTDEEKADLFGETFAKRFMLHSNSDPIMANFFRTIHTFVEKYFKDATPLDIDEITLPELEELLHTLQEKKTPGNDGLRNNALRRITAPWRQFLLNICNACLRIGYFPSGWKTAILVMLHKKGTDTKIPANYRPISLLPAVSKILEKCVLRRLTQFTDEIKVIPDEQFAFRGGHSCTQQLWRLTENIFHHWSMKHKVAAAFLDIERAYDSVWRDGVLYKMIQASSPRYLVYLVRSFLCDRYFRVRVGDCLSSTRPMEAGLPQGAVLSPLLYNIFTADIPKSAFSDHFLYADDTALVSYSSNLDQAVHYLQKAVDKVSHWMSLWRLTPNASKSQTVIFHTCARKPKFKVTLDGQELDWCDQATYLGVVFNKRMTFGPHIKYITNKMSTKLRRSYHLLGFKSLFSTEIKAFIYKVYCRSVWTYGLPSWVTVADSHWKTLQIMQNKFLAVILSRDGGKWNTVKDLHVKTGISSVTEHAQSLFVNFLEALDEHPNKELTKNMSYDITEMNPRPRRTRHFLRKVPVLY